MKATGTEEKTRLASHASFPELSQEPGKDGGEATGSAVHGNTDLPGESSTKTTTIEKPNEEIRDSVADSSSQSLEKEQQPGLANVHSMSASNLSPPADGVAQSSSALTAVDTSGATPSAESSSHGSSSSQNTAGSGSRAPGKPEFVHQKSQTQTLSTVHEEGTRRAITAESKGSGVPVSHQDSDTSEQSTSNNVSSTPREYPTEFVPLLQKVEGNYRMFAPVRASALPSFSKFGDVGEESFAILELIRKSLETVQQSMHDLVRVDVRLVNVGQLKFFDDIYEQYFQNVPVPQRNVVSVEPMEKGCSIEVEVTSLIRDALQGNSGRRELDHSSFGKASFGDQGHSHNRPPFDNAGISFCAFLGDILPARLAQAYGYYGEKQEQVLSGLLILTILRYLLLLLSIVSISLVETSDYQVVFDDSYELVRGPTWFVVVASLSVVHSSIICLYSFVWWYQGDEPDQKVEQAFYPIMIGVQHYGDLVFVFCSISAFTAIATLVPFTPIDTGKTRGRFVGASIISCFTFIVYILTFKLSWHTKRVFKQLGNRFRALRDVPLKPVDGKMEGVTTPVSQGSSAYNLAHASQSNSNTRLVTPNSGLPSHHLSQQYGTPMTISSGMRVQQSIPVRSSTPSSGGSKHHYAQTPFVAPGPIQVVQQFAPAPTSGPGPIGVSTPSSQSKRIIAQNLTNGQVQYFQSYDAVGAVNPNQVIYIQQQPNAGFQQQEGTPPLGRIVQNQQQYYQQSPTGYSSVQQHPQGSMQLQHQQPQMAPTPAQHLEEQTQPQTHSPSSNHSPRVQQHFQPAVNSPTGAPQQNVQDPG